jgi:mannose-6-phosphate isomerase-like protein (cupin superfamily)
MEEAGVARKPIVIAPEQGRTYEMGRMRAVFKADLEESAHRYSVSEWWMEPGTRGPGVHHHEEDHVFYVIAGTLSVWVNDHWSHLAKGAYVVIPGETPHNFENQGTVPAGFVSFTTPGGFEARMPEIASALGSEDLRL